MRKILLIDLKYFFLEVKTCFLKVFVRYNDGIFAEQDSAGKLKCVSEVMDMQGMSLL